MKSIISSPIFIALILSSDLCWGNSAANLEQTEFQLVQIAIRHYLKDTHKVPTSWDDLWSNPESKRSVEALIQGKVIGRRTDLVESFRFLALGTKIIIPSNNSQVIGMMIRPMRPPPDIQRRLLIVRLKDGSLEVMDIEEESLRGVITRAGLNFVNYTGENGNWAPETRLRPLSEIPPPPAKPARDHSNDFSRFPPLPENVPPSTPKDSAHVTLKETDHFQEWIIGGIAALLGMTFLVWMKFKK